MILVIFLRFPSVPSLFLDLVRSSRSSTRANIFVQSIFVSLLSSEYYIRKQLILHPNLKGQMPLYAKSSLKSILKSVVLYVSDSQEKLQKRAFSIQEGFFLCTYKVTNIH